jgi:ribosomal protein L11 methyltransferase
MNYIQLTLTPTPFSEAASDVLSSLLADLGFDSFETEADCLQAYCPEALYDAEAVRALLADLPLPDLTCTFTEQHIEAQDWNETWEREAFVPIVVDDRCVIHAPGAEGLPACRYDLTLTPRMSFGSGHHETTAQMLRRILDTPMEGRRVLDMGCGTGVLGILAARCGAAYVRAIDIDDWACRNAEENAALNGVTLDVACGDASLLALPQDSSTGHAEGSQADDALFDVVLANINRNILLADMAAYVRRMAPGAHLMMSGFYTEDLPSIRTCAEGLGLSFVDAGDKNNWVCVEFRK